MSLKETFAALGRPRKIEGEKMVVAQGLLASSVRPLNGGVYFLPEDEIIRRSGYRIYRDMMNDEQVKLCMAFKKILIAGRTWELKPKDDSPRAKEAASFLEWCMKKAGFIEAIEEMLTAMENGYALAEQVFTRDTYDGKQVVCIDKFAVRDPETLNLGMDEHGNFKGALQRVGMKEITLTPDVLWLYSHNARFGNIFGQSDLKAAYRSYWAKKFIINFWNVFLERMGQPMMLMHYPAGAGDELKQTLKEILTNLANKTEVLVPEGVEANLVEAQRSGNATYEEALNFHDKAIAKALLVASLFGTGGEQNKTQGAQSQSSIQLRVLFKLADQISQKIACSFMKQVAYPLLAMNYDGNVDDFMPVFVWQDYGQFEGMKVADTIRLLFAAGILDLDQADVNYCRSILGLPLRLEGDKEDEVHRPTSLPPPGNANAPPPAAGQGNERAKKGGDTTTTTKD